MIHATTENTKTLHALDQPHQEQEGPKLTFWESQARDMRANAELGSTVPRKMVLHWFMPALANSSVGSLTGTTGLLGTAVCAFVWKNSMKVLRTRSPAAYDHHQLCKTWYCMELC